jgi:thiamine pyrophosphokinase
MIGAAERPQMELRGLRQRAGVRGAVLVLHGARLPDLRRAGALAGSLADRCMLVAVDGGLKTCLEGRRRPDLFVGDGDSAKAPPADTATILFDREKDFSDLSGALGELRKRKVQFVALAGLLGGRLDHEWANLLELGRWSRSFAGFLAPTDRGTIVVTGHGCRVVTVPRRTVSLFSLISSATVTLTGTRWELQHRQLRPGSHGLSNVTGTELDLTVHSGAVALVFLPPRRRRVPSRAGS